MTKEEPPYITSGTQLSHATPTATKIPRHSSPPPRPSTRDHPLPAPPTNTGTDLSVSLSLSLRPRHRATAGAPPPSAACRAPRSTACRSRRDPTPDTVTQAPPRKIHTLHTQRIVRGEHMQGEEGGAQTHLRREIPTQRRLDCCRVQPAESQHPHQPQPVTLAQNSPRGESEPCVLRLQGGLGTVLVERRRPSLPVRYPLYICDVSCREGGVCAGSDQG